MDKKKTCFFCFFGQEVLKSLIWIFLCYSNANRKYILVYAICFNCSLFFLHETEKKIVFGQFLILVAQRKQRIFGHDRISSINLKTKGTSDGRRWKVVEQEQQQQQRWCLVLAFSGQQRWRSSLLMEKIQNRYFLQRYFDFGSVYLFIQ